MYLLGKRFPLHYTRVRSVLTTAVTVSSSFAGDTLGVYRPLGAEVVLHTAAGSACIGASVAASW